MGVFSTMFYKWVRFSRVKMQMSLFRKMQNYFCFTFSVFPIFVIFSIFDIFVIFDMLPDLDTFWDFLTKPWNYDNQNESFVPSKNTGHVLSWPLSPILTNFARKPPFFRKMPKMPKMAKWPKMRKNPKNWDPMCNLSFTKCASVY